jgi:hypothetical protein
MNFHGQMIPLRGQRCSREPLHRIGAKGKQAAALRAVRSTFPCGGHILRHNEAVFFAPSADAIGYFYFDLTSFWETDRDAT